METKVDLCMVVPEVLNDNNYPDWRVRITTYLKARDLWEIVDDEPPKQEDDVTTYKAWNTKNFMALHVIQNACGPNAFRMIRRENSAKRAWHVLAEGIGDTGLRPLLDKDNYLSWCMRVKTYLESRDLWDYLEIGPDNSEAAFDVIKKSCGPTMMSVIEECHLAKDAWKKLFHEAMSPVQRSDQADTLLQEAMRKHNWVDLKKILDRRPELRVEKISVDGDTLLHWAVLHDNTSIVKELVKSMTAGELEVKNDKGMTALAQVAACGNIQMAKCMLQKNKDLISIADGKNRIPVVIALEYGDKDIARYLYKETIVVLNKDEAYVPTLLVSCIFANAFDIALDLLKPCKTPIWSIQQDTYSNTPLSALASQPSISFSRSRLIFWEQWIYACIPEKLVHSSTYKRKETWIDIEGQNQQQSHEVNVYGFVLRLLHWTLTNLLKLLGMKHIYELRVQHVQALELQSRLSEHFATTVCQFGHKSVDKIFQKEKVFIKAVKAGNHELIENILRKNPIFLLLTDSNSRSLFAYAVLYRQPRIFSLIYDLEAKDEIVNTPDESGNTLLHMVGMLELATDQIECIPGAALQMSRELQWFKEIEGMSSLFTREMKNDSGETAREIFTKNHKNMKDAGEKWMKATASSNSVVGTLIITITFAATITVPGGNNGDKGFPIFSDKPIFLLFVISNALSFVSSIAAILTYLVILTTSYAEEDFISSLPKKMAIGLSTLSFSIVTMMIAFCAALFIMMPGQLWITILIICLASISVIWFLLEKYPNFVEITKSAYGPHMFDKKLKSGLSKWLPYASQC